MKSSINNTCYGEKQQKLYGFIYHCLQGLEIHIAGYPYHMFIGYTERQAKEKYRELFGLKYKRITWL